MVTSIDGFSDFDGGGGVCRHLKGNLCAIYETRPLFCDSERVYATFFKDSMTESEFIEKTLELCLDLIQRHGDNQAIVRIKNVIKNRKNEKTS
jgi:Fe-S-cluster containining protein